jgi:hypothetical protein
MSDIVLRVAARPVDWGGLAILTLLTLALGAYAVLMLGGRVRLAVRAGWSGVRTHWGLILGLLFGTAGFALASVDLVTGWLAETHGTGINWHAHQWTSIPIMVCGFMVTWTEPGRPRSVLDSTIAAKARAHPRQALAGLLVGAATWALLPLSAALAASLPIPMLFAWPLALLAETVVAIWWWWRHGQIEELTDGQRTVYLPAYGTHPAFWGWIMGSVGTLLLWTTLAQMRTGL